MLRHPLLLQFVFAAELPPAELDERLVRYAEGVAATRLDYAARLGSEEIFSLARTARERAVWQLAIEHGLGWCDAELRWIARARKQLSRARKQLSRAPKGRKRWTRRTR